MPLPMRMLLRLCLLLISPFCCDHPLPAHPKPSPTQQVWQGVDIWADTYRVNMSDLLSGLETLADVLVDSELALEALPLLALWEHVALHVTRNVGATVMCRIQRARALVSLGLLPAASKVLIQLMQGRDLPDPVIPDAALVVKSEDGAPLLLPAVAPLSGRHAPGTQENKPVLGLIAHGPVPAPVEALYGGWAVARLALVRAAFLMRIGGMPNLWRSVNPASGKRVGPGPSETKADAKGKPATGKGPAAAAAAATATAGAAAGGEVVTLPEAVEASLLEAAVVLVGRAKGFAEGRQLEPEVGSPDGPALGGGAGDAKGAKDKKPPAKPMTPPGKKKDAGAAAAAAGGAAGGAEVEGSGAGAVSADVLAAQRTEVGVRAALAASEAEGLRWRPLAALEAALGALRMMGGQGTDGKLNLPLGDNDDTERYALCADLWLRARLQAARCALALRHTDACGQLVAAGLSEAAEANDGLAAAQLLAMRATMHEAAGRVADALNTYGEALDRFAALHVWDLRTAAALSATAALRDRLGLRADAANLAGRAAGLLSDWVSQLGLSEAQDHPELINVYAQGVTDFAAALVAVARCAARALDLTAATAHLETALGLLRRHTRALPSQHADTLLALGRSLRLQVLMGPPRLTIDGGANNGTSSSPAGRSDAELLGLSGGHLEAALVVSALDAGHVRGVMRAALLEMASSAVAGAAPARAAACLRAAHAAATKHDVLSLSSHTLTPVTIGALPDWAKEFVMGQEVAFAAAHVSGIEWVGKASHMLHL